MRVAANLCVRTPSRTNSRRIRYDITGAGPVLSSIYTLEKLIYEQVKARLSALGAPLTDWDGRKSALCCSAQISLDPGDTGFYTGVVAVQHDIRGSRSRQQQGPRHDGSD